MIGYDLVFIEEKTDFAMIYAALFFITISRTFIPSYNPLKLEFPNYYPISVFQKYSLSLLGDYIKPFFFYMLSFILTATFFRENADFNFLATAFAYLILGNIVRQNIQYVIDFKLTKNAYLASFIAIGLIIIASINIAFSFLDGVLISWLLVVLFFLLGYYQHYSIIDERKSSIANSSSKRGINFKLIVNNKKARMLIIVGLFFKIIVIVVLIIQAYKGKELLVDNIPIMWLFITPLAFFTYFYNNIWAFWPSLMVNMELRNGDYYQMIKQGLQLMKFPLLIDFILALPLLYIFSDKLVFISLFYITSVVFLVSFSFFWSALLPIKVKKVFQRKGATNMWSSMATMLAIAILALMQVNAWFYIISPFFLAMSAAAIWFSKDIYRDNKHKIYEKIM
ncbi:MAG: hypothetical protein B6I18_00560 [Bacteroidetes bacterium 4572_112]|nr:MAG: hypothetical protein B6I18_00560 [Bacteroidetes bacterium 4572_112]